MEFVTRDVGRMAAGSGRRRRLGQQFPDWMDPQEAASRREWPHLAIELETHDGGKNWSPSTSSIFGRITAARFSPQGWGLGLIEFSDTFEWPSEVYSKEIGRAHV